MLVVSKRGSGGCVCVGSHCAPARAPVAHALDARQRARDVSPPRLSPPPTFSRCVSSCSALYCATTDLTTSLPMEGSTRSSQSMPRLCVGVMCGVCVCGGGRGGSGTGGGVCQCGGGGGGGCAFTMPRPPLQRQHPAAAWLQAHRTSHAQCVIQHVTSRHFSTRHTLKMLDSFSSFGFDRKRSDMLTIWRSVVCVRKSECGSSL